MKAFGEIKKGKLILNNKQQFQDQLMELEGMDVVIKIIERKIAPEEIKNFFKG